MVVNRGQVTEWPSSSVVCQPGGVVFSGGGEILIKKKKSRRWVSCAAVALRWPSSQPPLFTLRSSRSFASCCLHVPSASYGASIFQAIQTRLYIFFFFLLTIPDCWTGLKSGTNGDRQKAFFVTLVVFIQFERTNSVCLQLAVCLWARTSHVSMERRDVLNMFIQRYKLAKQKDIVMSKWLQNNNKCIKIHCTIKFMLQIMLLG